VLVLLVIGPRMPLAEFFEPVQADELILRLRRRPVFAPYVPLFQYDLPFADKLF